MKAADLLDLWFLCSFGLFHLALLLSFYLLPRAMFASPFKCCLPPDENVEITFSYNLRRDINSKMYSRKFD